MTQQEAIRRMRAPGDYRPTWRGGVIQIHITRACDLSCIGCTQGSNLAGKPVMMSVSQFEEACKSLEGYQGVIGIFGGNPTLHPEFRSICDILCRYFPFDQRGLWSNNLNGYGSLCRDVFDPRYSNLNVHTSSNAYLEMKNDWPESNPKGLHDSRHSPPFVALRDMEDISDDERWDLISDCDINQFWSAMICVFRNKLRAFFCELAGAQSMLHENDPEYPDTGMALHPRWYTNYINRFERQITKHCMECGIPLRGFGDLAVGGTTEYVSKTHEGIYRLKKPAGKTVKLVSKTSDLNGTLFRATDYCENGFIELKQVNA